MNSEKDAQADVGELRCEVGLYDNKGGILKNGTCTANPSDCGTPWEGEVILCTARV